MNRELQIFLLQSQRSAALLMGSFCVLLVMIQWVLMGSFSLFEDAEPHLEISHFLWLPLITGALAWLEFFNAKRVKQCLTHCEEALGFSRYLSAIGEALLPTLGILVILAASNWEVAMSGPPLLGYFVIIIISMLRMEGKITLLIGVIEGLCYLALVVVCIVSRDAESPFTDLDVRLLFGRVIVILLATAIAVFIAGKMRALLNQLISSHEAQTSTLQELVTAQAEKTQAEQVIWQKNQLLSILGHDLRTPLNGVSGLSELMANAPERFSAAEIRGYAIEIHKTSQSLRDLLDNLLAWAQCRTGQMELTPRDYTLEALLDPVVQVLTPAITAKAITLCIEVDRAQCIQADRQSVQTILRNILSNAVKYTPSAGTIRIVSSKNSSRLSLKFIDSGAGIPETVFKNLANNKLSQSSYGTKQESGTGLGLLLCLDLVRRAGIKLELSNNTAGGAQAEVIFS